jgi:hypothetical protein
VGGWQVSHCSLCESDFGWNASLANTEDLQKLRHRHHCVGCGRVVCDECSARRATHPRLGIHVTMSRTCDACFWGWNAPPPVYPVPPEPVQQQPVQEEQAGAQTAEQVQSYPLAPAIVHS